MPDLSKAPAFLHQSYQHENVLELCGFTSIANVQPPNTAATTATPSEGKIIERWLVWVDKRRGLLGRTVVTCPTRNDPLPGRRHTQQFSARPTAEEAVPKSDSTLRRKEVHQATRSSSLVTGQATLHDKAAATAAASDPVRLGAGERRPKCDEGIADKDCGRSQEEKAERGVGGDQRKRLPYVEIEADTSSLRSAVEPSAHEDIDVGNLATSSNHPPLDSNACYGKVQVLLDGLNRPSRVAAVPGRKSKGVFFIDEAAVEEDNSQTISPVSPPKNDSQQSDSCLQHQPTRHVGRVRFLPWGAREAITLVEGLCNPIALCVHADSSVFVLEELWKTKNQKHRDGDQEHEIQSQERYRVLRCMGGTDLSAWLDNETKRSTSCRDREDRFQYNGKLKFAVDAGEHHYDATENHGTTETEQESASNSSPCGLPKSDRCNYSLRRGVVDFVEVLALPVSPESCRHHEQPVDLCVLNDRTIVVAFYRSAPLHGGAAVSENQGAIRVFPVTRQEGHHSDALSGAIESDSMSGRRSPAATASRSALDTDTDSSLNYFYSSGESWLVAEGLPVVTGIDAGGGRGIYFSLCGAGHDGVVTAIGSLSTAARVSPASPRSIAFSADKNNSENQAGHCTGDVLASGGVDGRGGMRTGGKSSGCGVNFVRVVSGFAAALTVDEDMNLYYVTAESKRSCHALWCSVPGVCNRRVSILREISPTLLVTGTQVSGVPKGGVVVAPRSDAGSEGSAESYPKKQTDGGRHAQRGKANLDAAVAAKVAAADQAVALSAALTEEDQAVRAGSRGKKPLFTSHHAVNVQAKEEGSGTEGEGGREEPANIVVVSRCRPLLLREIKRGVRAAVFCDGDEVVVKDKALPTSRWRRFGFDRVFGPSTSQARVYAEGVSPVVRKMLDGYNCSVLAYGQTGSGKTFTMEGGLSGYPRNPARGATTTKAVETSVAQNIVDANLEAVSTDDIGIIPRAVHTIFREGGGGGTRRYWVYVSHMEIYNERLFDLLAPEASAATATPLSPLPSPKRRSPRADGAAGTVDGAKLPCPTESSFPRKSPRSSPPRRQYSPRPLSPRRRNCPRPLSSTRQKSPRADREQGEGGGSKSARIEHPNSSSRSPRRSDRGVRCAMDGGISPRLSPVKVEVWSPRRGDGRDRPWNVGGGVGRGLAIEENRELGVIVKGLTQVEVKSPEEIFAIIARSKSNRRTAETMCNVESSRSHGIFCVRVISAEPTPWGGEITRDGRLSLVDLSGSENIKRSGAVGARAKEAAAIGQSLLALGRVIKALVKGAPHIPYRESKLTRVLGDSLGGNAYTAIILNITPNHGMLDETLNTLLYAKTAQSVRNAPKQHITNKPPSEVATTGDAATGPQTVDDNAVKDTRRGRGATSSRSSPGSTRMHIRPWESKVPIRGFPPNSVPPLSHSFEKPHETDMGAGGRFCGDPLRSRQGKGNAPSCAVGKRSTRKRPQTAGARTRSTFGTQVFPHERERHSDKLGFTAAGREVSPMTVGAIETRYERGMEAAVRFAHGMPWSMSEQQLLARSGHEPPVLQHAVSDSRHAWGTSKEQSPWGGGSSPAGGTKKAACRVFNSAAAVWVHSMVLEPSNHARNPPKPAHAGTPQMGTTELQPLPSTQRKSINSSTEPMRLTAVAQRVIEEIFDRYDVEDQGFLPSSGISSIQQLWSRPDAEPPPPRRPTSASLPRLRRETEPSKNRRGSAARLAGNGCESYKRDMRALTRKSFVEFCRRAAARDAIFIRHMFTRSGYDNRLELSPGMPEAVAASTAALARARVSRARSAAVEERKLRGDAIRKKNDPKVVNGSTGRANTTQNSSHDLPQGSVIRGGVAKTTSGGGGGGGAGRRRSSACKGLGQQPRRSEPIQSERGVLRQHENDDTQDLASGGIVDAAELWDWTEDRRDHGERHEQGGLLSRGGGAHVSRAGPGATAGGFASRTYAELHPDSITGLVTGEKIPSSPGCEEGVRTAPASSPQGIEATEGCIEIASCSPVPPVTGAATHDRDATCNGEKVPSEDHGRSTAGGTAGNTTLARQGSGELDAVAVVDDNTRTGRVDSEEPIAARRISPCLWCGAVFDVNDGMAVHTVEFCDEDSVVALDVR